MCSACPTDLSLCICSMLPHFVIVICPKHSDFPVDAAPIAFPYSFDGIVDAYVFDSPVNVTGATVGCPWCSDKIPSNMTQIIRKVMFLWPRILKWCSYAHI